MKDFAELLTAIGTLAWPTLAALALYFLYPFIRDFLSRDKVRIKIGEMELSTEQVTESLSDQLKDLQDKVLEIERKLPSGPAVAAPDSAKTQAAAREATQPRALSSARERRILWVDDRPSNYAIQIEKLRGEGWSIDLATSTAEGLKLVENDGYDLVITDIGRDEAGIKRGDAGIQLAKEIRQRNSQIPIIVFSTRQAISRFQASAQRAGVNYLTNSTVELYRYIDSVLAKKANAD